MKIPKLSIGATATAFLIPAAVVIMASLLLTMRQADANTGPDPARFSGSVVIQRMPSLLPAARLPGVVSVSVVRDEAAASYYQDPAALDSVLSGWRDLLAATGADARIVRSSALAGARDADVLVVPASPCLSIATHEAIAYAKAHGQGLIITGQAGVEDAACRPLGYGFIVGMTGASRAERLDGRDMVYVTVPSGGPLAIDIPPGARLDLKPAGQVALRVRGRDAFYSDYALQPLPAHDMPLVDGAIAHDLVERARVVYWGFDPRDAVSLPWNREILQLLARNAVAWAAALPLAEVEPWPAGKRAAAVLAQDVESGFDNAGAILDSLAPMHVASTFFLTSKLAVRNEDLVRRLSAAGEIGTHSENHRLLGGLPADIQRRRLELTQRDLKGLLGYRVHGLRPPEEQFDQNTMAQWLGAGGTYLFGANDSRSAAPELLRVGRDTVVLIGRAGGDDFAVLSAEHGKGVDSIADTFVAEFDRFRALGGLYVLSYHSQLLARPELLGALSRTARALARDSDVWLTTTGAVAGWWSRRAQLATSVEQRPDGRAVVVARNASRDPISGAVVRLLLPGMRRPVSATAPLLPPVDGMVRLALPPIPPHATRSFTVSPTGAARLNQVRAPHAVRRARARRAPAGWGRWFSWLR